MYFYGLNFSYIMSPYSYALLGIVALSCVAIIVWYVRRYGVVARANDTTTDNVEVTEPVSIILYSNNNIDKLKASLDSFLAQDYPLYEIIVVDDGKDESIKDELMRMSIDYKNLYYTYVPTGTLNLSRKKLCITLGIKAAKYDVIITTTDSCVAKDDKWLSSMMRNFDVNTEVVIGYSHAKYENVKGISRFYHQFDDVVSSVQYLSYALRGNVYRGDGNNLAYRKHLFFDNKGFHCSLNLHYGEDDIFVNEITNSINTKVELSTSSILNTCKGADSFKENKLRYDFTSKYINSPAYKSSGFISLLHYIALAAAGVFVYLSDINIIGIALALIMFICVAVTEIVMYRKSAKVLESKKLLFSIPLFILFRPFVNFSYKLINYKLRKRNYTWSRL